MLLILCVPVIELGLNKKDSFSRTNYNVYTIYEKNDSIHLDSIFTENTNHFCYLTIKGAKILSRLARAEKIGILAENMPINDHYSNNYGINAENTIIENIKGMTKASREDDINNKIDCYFYNMPAQIKSCVHGISEQIRYSDENTKKYGISVINADIAELEMILDK